MALSKVGKNQVDQSASLTVDSDLTVDTNTLYVDSTNNRVGVGTASPVSTMDVNGLISFGGNTSRSINYRSGDNDILYEFDAGDFYRQDIGNSTHSWFTGNSERMRLDSSGRVTMPYQPSFGVYTTTGQTVGNTIQFNGTSFNTGNHFNTSTGIFTAPVAGKYWFYWHLLTDRTTNSGEGYVDLFKNGGYHYRNYEPKESSLNQHQEFKGGLIVDMATSDTVYLVYTAAVSGNIVGSLQHCTFSGFLIG